MKRIAHLAATLVLCGSSTFATAQATHQPTDVGTLEHVLEATYHLHAQHIPMMGLINGFASKASKGGVKDMRVLTYENLPAGLDHKAMGELAVAHLQADWSVMVRETSAEEGENELVFVQPAGKRFRMLVMSLEANELNLVQMDLSSEDLKKWQDQHGS